MKAPQLIRLCLISALISVLNFFQTFFFSNFKSFKRDVISYTDHDGDKPLRQKYSSGLSTKTTGSRNQNLKLEGQYLLIH